MFYSPLRYPGGKGKLAPFMTMIVEKTGHMGGTYIEPFAGGAGVALDLLLNDRVSEIVINDLDKGIYSFWRAILTDTDRFLLELNRVPVTMDEWHRQRAICENCSDKYSFELGFATFFMNRTNRSGIIKGGVIGGLSQDSKWTLDVRFNKVELAKRISAIASRKKSIHLYNKDVHSFITRYMPKYSKNALVYFDPPYFEKGKELYLNFFQYEDHKKIEETIRRHVTCDWIITYDDEPEIAHIYSNYVQRKFDLNYSAARKRRASEIMIFSEKKIVPTQKDLSDSRICINLR